MRSHRRIRRRVRTLALGLTAIAALAPAGALAQPINTDAAVAHERYYSSFGAGGTKTGDTPATYPGASRTPRYDAPDTVRIVQPERTVVRDADQALPIVLAGLALLIALGGAGFVLVRTRALQRHAVR
jgi:Alphavirus glycoprotein J